MGRLNERQVMGIEVPGGGEERPMGKRDVSEERPPALMWRGIGPARYRF